MAILRQGEAAAACCNHCGAPANVTVESPRYLDSNPVGYKAPIVKVEYLCDCRTYNTNTFNPTTSSGKETTVAKTFDTTETKSVALNTIVSKVQQLERTLYSRTEARELLEAEHTKRVANATSELDRVLAEAYQSGLEEEDLELHLPDYDEYLSERLSSVAQEMSLANVLEGV